MVFGGLLFLLFWAGVIWLAIWAASGGSSRAAPPSRSDPWDIARERYARGDISPDEFERIRQDLGKSPSPHA